MLYFSSKSSSQGNGTGTALTHVIQIVVFLFYGFMVSRFVGKEKGSLISQTPLCLNYREDVKLILLILFDFIS